MTIYSVTACFYNYDNNIIGVTNTHKRTTKYNYSDKTIYKKALKYVRAQAKKLRQFTIVSMADMVYTIYEPYEYGGIFHIQTKSFNQIIV